jgi:hypothetical protein
LKVSSAPPGVLAESRYAPDEFAIFKRTQAQLVHSSLVLNGTLRDRAINQLPFVRHVADPVSWLKNRLAIDYPDDGEIMRISLTGENPEDVEKIVDMVADVYLQEIVEASKQMRLADEEKLRRAHEQQTQEYEKQLSALRKLESIHKTSGSEAAQLMKQLALDDLHQALATRARIVEELRQLNVAIAVAEGRATTKTELRTTKASEVKLAQANAGEPTLEELKLRRTVLEEQHQASEKAVESLAAKVIMMESFSAQVAAKQEELKALQTIKDHVGAQLDRALVERLAPSRVVKVDNAILEDGAGDAMRRNLTLSGVAAFGLLLFTLGMVIRRPRLNPTVSTE